MLRHRRGTREAAGQAVEGRCGMEGGRSWRETREVGGQLVSGTCAAVDIHTGKWLRDTAGTVMAMAATATALTEVGSGGVGKEVCGARQEGRSMGEMWRAMVRLAAVAMARAAVATVSHSGDSERRGYVGWVRGWWERGGGGADVMEIAKSRRGPTAQGIALEFPLWESSQNLADGRLISKSCKRI